MDNEYKSGQGNEENQENMNSEVNFVLRQPEEEAVDQTALYIQI